jgi:asparagine synthase (glutamine-hydrolysing)
MCGFIGQISETKDSKDLLSALPWLKRRGPDSQNLWYSRDKQIGIMHARLAIVDKDPKANQPFCDQESGLTVAFTGEIYNFQELKNKFSSLRFRTESDTEVILAVFNEYGVKGLNLLKGVFSLAIIDEKNKKIFLARDPIGKKPLYLARWQDNVFFGVSVLALAAANKKPVEINPEVLAYYWENAFIHPATSVLSGARPVLPGRILELDWRGNIVKEERIQPEKKYLYRGESLERVNALVGALLKEAVKRRLQHNPRPAVLLSGGIDSTLVCKIAHDICKESSRPLEAITLKSLIPLTQDEAYARFAARRMNLALRLVAPSLNNIQDAVIRAVDLQDEPLGMPSFFLLERLVNASSSHSRILLSGDGGDEAFLGYGSPADWYTGERTDTANQPQTNYGLEVPSWMSDWARRTVTDCLVGHMLAKADRASAEQGVEMRCPLLDGDLINYVRSLPFEILVHGGRSKALLKGQLGDWPQWFLERPKLGFAYNLRWHWALSNYSGLRESIDKTAIETFRPYLPLKLRRPAYKWRCRDIFGNFEAAWRLLVWSRFLERLKKACS